MTIFKRTSFVLGAFFTIFSLILVNPVSALDNDAFKSLLTPFYDPDAVACGLTVVSGDPVARFVQILARQESGSETGDPTVTNETSTASGRYQYLNQTWQGQNYYPAAHQYKRAKDAPSEVQDAVAYIEYSSVFFQYQKKLNTSDINSLIFYMGIHHYLPAAVDDPSRLDIVPDGNTISVRDYGEATVAHFNDPAFGKKVNLNFTSAPDFINKYAKAIGKPYGSTRSTPQNTAKTASVEAVAKKYGLQSAIVKQINGQVIGKYNADNPPNAPASVLKLIIADLFLQEHPNLSSSQTNLLEQMLENSSNDAANTLMDQTGKLPLTPLARSRGYQHTAISAHYENNATRVINSTTVSDLTRAMENIFTGTTEGYKKAQTFLQNDNENFGINSYANKWGGVSGSTTGKPVTGNSAVFVVGGARYIITMYINEPYIDSGSSSVTKIRNATNELYSSISSTNPVTESNTCVRGSPAGNFVFYEQGDSPWGGHQIYSGGDRTISTSGCGPTSAAMVIATLVDSTVDPIKTGDFMTGLGDGVGYTNEGATANGLVKTLENWGLRASSISSLDAASQVIQHGGLVIAGGAGTHPFSAGGHVVVLRGVDASGNFLIGNPSLGLNDNDQNHTYSAAQLQSSLKFLIGVSQ